jgi:hypothetical protein
MPMYAPHEYILVSRSASNYSLHGNVCINFQRETELMHVHNRMLYKGMPLPLNKLLKWQYLRKGTTWSRRTSSTTTNLSGMKWCSCLPLQGNYWWGGVSDHVFVLLQAPHFFVDYARQQWKYMQVLYSNYDSFHNCFDPQTEKQVQQSYKSHWIRLNQ